MTCTHALDSSDCHNRDEFPCPSHFTVLCASMMQGAANVNHDQIDPAMRDLARHNWLTPAVYTWAAIFQYHMLLHREDPETVLRHQLKQFRLALDSGEKDTAPWVNRFTMICRAAVMGDGEMISDVLLSMQGDAGMTPTAYRSLLVSLARAAHDAVHLHASSSPQTVALLLTLGSQVYSPGAFGLVLPVVRIVESMSRGEEDHASARMAGGASPRDMAEAVVSAVRALGQCVHPDSPTVLIVGSAADGASGDVSGVLDWSNEQADEHTGEEALMYARAMRAAMAFATRDDDKLVAMASHSQDVVIDMLVGSVALLLNRIRVARRKAEKDHPLG